MSRDYGDGALFQRCEARYGCPPLDADRQRPEHACKGRWYAAVEMGWSISGTRRKRTVSAKTKAETLRRLNRLKRQIEDGAGANAASSVTVKKWIETYLELRKQPPKALSPNGWNAAASPLRKWVIPTIGHKRLGNLTPADIRAVAQAQYEAGRKTATADATQRALMTALNWAVQEGHVVPPRILKMPRPGMGKSDRQDMTLPEALACLKVAADYPNGIRWVLALLYGVRQGEALGIHDDEIDFDDHVIRLEWQLQDFPPEMVPRDYEARHLRGKYHLVRPKSRKGYRVLPMPTEVEDALKAWMEVRPPNRWGLVFPAMGARGKGWPLSDHLDRAEFREIQAKAGVKHPSGRPYHVHECRDFFATQQDQLGTGDLVLTSLIGHASITTTRGYQTAHLEEKRAAIEGLAKRLEVIKDD